MLSPEIVVTFFEGFQHEKRGFIIKELSICSNNYSDTVLCLPPISFNSLSPSERKSHQWVTKRLHGISWAVAATLTCFLSQIFITIKIRCSTAKFYAKGKEKTKTLQKLLQKVITNLQTLLCLKVEEIFTPGYHLTCSLHSTMLPFKQRKKHCAKRKAHVYFYSITLPTNEWSCGESNSCSYSSAFISKFDSMQLHCE